MFDLQRVPFLLIAHKSPPVVITFVHVGKAFLVWMDLPCSAIWLQIAQEDPMNRRTHAVRIFNLGNDDNYSYVLSCVYA